MLALFAIAIPVSEYFTSVFQFLLALNWVLEFDFKEKLKRIKANKSILLFPLLFLLHFVWLINTENFSYAFHDIKIKLPLLVLPVLIGSSPIISYKEIKILLLLFVSTIIVSSLISISVLAGIWKHEYSDIREISVFISHIRFSLMLVLSVFILVYYLLFQKKKLSRIEIFVFPLLIIWIIVFLYILNSLTGIFILAFTTILFLIYYANRIKHLVSRIFLLMLIISLFLIGFSYISKQVSAFYKTEIVSPETIDEKTVNGNQYEHNFGINYLENGNFVWLYYCGPELMSQWNKRSSIDFNGNDSKGQVLRYTLVRYLSSKGLRKDSAGICGLDQKDIENIENGIANYRFTDKYSLKVMIYKIIWQIDTYSKTGNPTGHSVTQRIEYLKTAFHIIQNNFWFGTGTGDVQLAFDLEYNKVKSPLPEKLRRRSHNQLVTFFVSFGFFGFFMALLSFFLPFFMNKKKWNFLISSFMIITALSMLNEDTLETQTGVSFIIFFYCFLIFACNFKSEQLLKDDNRKE
ncbi:MAG: O-antigen ligase family protein [Bacteroidota bacterium]